MRSNLVAYLLWFFLPCTGAHRFYSGNIGTGFLWLFTGGLVGIGWLVDVFLIPGMVREANATYFSVKRGSGAFAPLPQAHPTVTAWQPSPAIAGPDTQDRIVYCIHCGGPMRVPHSAVGTPYACPRCHTILEVPA